MNDRRADHRVTEGRETEPGLRALATAPADSIRRRAPMLRDADGPTRMLPTPGYCAANTNGTLTVVAPLDAGNCQLLTRLVMQLANPR